MPFNLLIIDFQRFQQNTKLLKSIIFKMSNQVGNYNNANYGNRNLGPNNQMNMMIADMQQNQAAYLEQYLNTQTNQPMYINGVDVNRGLKRIMLITEKWKTREPMDGKFRGDFCDCCWRQQCCLATCFPCVLGKMLAGPISN